MRSLLKTEPDVAEALLECIEMGMTIQASCGYAGISEETFYLWQRRSEEDELAGKTSRNSVYIKFMNEFKKAKGKCQRKHLKRIEEASENGSWQASAWILERRFPEAFGNKTQIDLSESKVVVMNDIPIEHDGED